MVTTRRAGVMQPNEDEEEIVQATSTMGVGGVAAAITRRSPTNSASSDADDEEYEEPTKQNKNKRGRRQQKGNSGGGTTPKKARPPTKKPAAKKKKATRTHSQESKTTLRDGADVDDAVLAEEKQQMYLKAKNSFLTRFSYAWKKCMRKVQEKCNEPIDYSALKVGGVDLTAVNGKNANAKKDQTARVAAFEEFRGTHQDEWNETMIGGAQDYDKYAFATREKRETFYVTKDSKSNYKHVSNWVAGDTHYLPGNIVQALPGVDRKLAMVVKNIPSHLSMDLAQMYGDCEELGYTSKFVKHGIYIQISREDNRYWDLFQKEEQLQKEAMLAELKAINALAQADWLEDETAPFSEELFKKATTKTNEEEGRMMSGGVVAGGDGTANVDSDGEYTYSDTSNGPTLMTRWVRNALTVAKEMWGKKKKTVKKPKKDSDPKNSAKGGKKNVTGEGEGDRYGWQKVHNFYNKLKIKPTFMTANRASFMMDRQFVARTAGMGGREGDPMRPNDMNEANISSADSTLHNKFGRNSHLLMTDLVARSIYDAVFNTYGPDGDDDEDEGETQTGAVKTLLKELLVDESWEKCALHSGTIRQPKAPIHQGLHLDNNLCLQDPIVKKIMMQEEISAEEWVKLGYVVDLPLSQEGLWLRVAIPDPVASTFFMHWVYVPYGSMLIRSMALLHSGHYGSPGNCRYHATFTPKSTDLHTEELAYLARMREGVVCDFSEWNLKWSPNIPREGWTAGGYKRIKCKEWNTDKRIGTTYFTNYIQKMMIHPFGKNILQNLSPYTLLVKLDEEKNMRDFCLDCSDPRAMQMVNKANTAHDEEKAKAKNKDNGSVVSAIDSESDNDSDEDDSEDSVGDQAAGNEGAGAGGRDADEE